MSLLVCGDYTTCLLRNHVLMGSSLYSLQCAHIGVGDLVLVPSFTMVAVPNAVLYVGAIPVFVDNAKGE